MLGYASSCLWVPHGLPLSKTCVADSRAQPKHRRSTDYPPSGLSGRDCPLYDVERGLIQCQFDASRTPATNPLGTLRIDLFGTVVRRLYTVSSLILLGSQALGLAFDLLIHHPRADQLG